MSLHAFSFSTEARRIKNNMYAAVIHVSSDADGVALWPEVVITAPHSFEKEALAHRAANDYALLMKTNGALQIAINMRRLMHEVHIENIVKPN